MNKSQAICLSALLSLSGAVEAKTLYVDRATGSDTTSYESNSATSPWATIGRAAWGSSSRATPNANQAARAGDTVIVRAGTYSTAGTDDRYGIAYNPVNSGTSALPIVFQADGVVVLTLSSSRGPVIGAYQRDYIRWRGFTINEANAPSRADTGPAVLSSTVGSSIEDSVLIGDLNVTHVDNHPGIRLDSSSHLTVRNNRISNFRTTVVNGHNGAGIQVYYSGNIVIENNEILDCGSGIFLKAPMMATGVYDIRRNFIRAIWAGIAVHRSPNTAASPIRAYQNIIVGGEAGVRIWAFDQGNTDPTNAQIVNNTIYGSGTGLVVSWLLVPNAGHIFQNNIVANSSAYAINYGGNDLVRSKLLANHNVYHTFPTFAVVYTSNVSFAQWQSQFGQDSLAPVSSVSNPMFVDAGQLNFRLQSVSVARSAGVDLLDLNGNGSRTDTVPAGAYITGDEIIGRLGQGVSPPSPPAGVTVE